MTHLKRCVFLCPKSFYAKNSETMGKIPRNEARAAFRPGRNVAFLHIREINHDIIDKTTMDFGKKALFDHRRIVDFRLDHGAE